MPLSGEFWAFVIAAGLFSGVVGTALTLVAQAVGRLWLDRSYKRLLAIRLAASLEDYGARCVRAAMDLKNYESSRGALGADLVALPNGPNLLMTEEQAAAWRAMPAALVNRCMSFPQQIDAAVNSVAFARQLDGHPMDHALLQTLRLGVAAFDLASDLREQLGWPGSPEAGGMRLWAVDELAKVTADQKA